MSLPKGNVTMLFGVARMTLPQAKRIVDDAIINTIKGRQVNHSGKWLTEAMEVIEQHRQQGADVKAGRPSIIVRDKPKPRVSQ